MSINKFYFLIFLIKGNAESRRRRPGRTPVSDAKSRRQAAVQDDNR
ncbi:hypothetical protein CLOM621_06351 [Clostridium sp. M62/1]|nr:hypothetical protein CLOM621_06351 [Clostridium sp. M62/1]